MKKRKGEQEKKGKSEKKKEKNRKGEKGTHFCTHVCTVHTSSVHTHSFVYGLDSYCIHAPEGKWFLLSLEYLFCKP